MSPEREGQRLGEGLYLPVHLTYTRLQLARDRSGRCQRWFMARRRAPDADGQRPEFLGKSPPAQAVPLACSSR